MNRLRNACSTWVGPGLMMGLALQFAGCALLVSKNEYRSYRAARMADVAMSRLTHTRAYLDAYPDGHWAAEFRASQAAQEALVFEENRNNREGLTRYLQVYPQGLFAEQARSRLSALSLLEARKRDQQAKAQAAAEQQRQEDALRRRTWVGRFMGELVVKVVKLSGWKEPIGTLAEKNPEFSAMLGRPPRPRCTEEECLKYYSGLYTLQLPNAAQLERTAQLLLRVRIEQGKVVGMDILLPGWGFSRWYESQMDTLVMDGEPEERARATAWAQTEIERLLEAQGAPKTTSSVKQGTLASFSPPAVGPADEFIDTSAESLMTLSMLPGKASRQGQAGPDAADVSEEMPEMELEIFELSADDEQDSPSPAGVDEAQGGPMGVVSAEPEVAAPEILSSYRLNNLRIQVFAAPAGAGAPAYDGIRIEP